MFKQFVSAALIVYIGFFVMIATVIFFGFTVEYSLNDLQAGVGIAVIILSAVMICIGAVSRYYIYRKSLRRFEARFLLSWPPIPSTTLSRLMNGDKKVINSVTAILMITVGCPPRD